MSLRYNLGCGPDLKPGYVNVDQRPFWHPNIETKEADLSQFPWPFENASASEVLMFDFLEHFEYRLTDSILQETWRMLEPGGFVDIQVPDLDQTCLILMQELYPRYPNQPNEAKFACNVCESRFWVDTSKSMACIKCGQALDNMSQIAMQRLYGGQDYPGNYHKTAFTKRMLELKLRSAGFHNFKYLEEEHQWKNWNFKVRAYKREDLWT